MKNKLFILVFVFILAIGIILRFYKLGDIPNSLDWDEVSWGYNAYSILLAGKDEYGLSHPLSFKAFGDYKQPMYVYLQLIPIKVFDLNAFSVRFPSAFLGSLSIVFVFLLVYEIFKKQENAIKIAFLAMLFFSISPWSIQFSRVAFEANVGLFFVILGSYLFIRGLNTQKIWYFFISSIFLALSAYSYHSEKIFSPLFFLGLLIYGYQSLINRKKFAIVIIIFFFLCNILWITDARTTMRGKSVMFTSQQTEILKYSTRSAIQDQNRKDKIGEVLHNRRLVYLNKYFQNYLSYFDLNFLFIEGDNSRHHAPGMGVLYIFSLPFIILGIYKLINRSLKSAWILLYWFLLAPIAAALAIDAPNASRSMIFLPTWDIFTAVGIILFLDSFKKNFIGKLFKGVIIIIFVFNFFYYIDQYFNHTNYEYGYYWQHGYREAVIDTNKYEDLKNKVFFANDLEQSYIFYLFYNKYDPSLYIKTGGSNRIVKKCFSISGAFFGNCQDKISKGDILVTSKVNNKMKEIKSISSSGGLPIKIYKNLE